MITFVSCIFETYSQTHLNRFVSKWKETQVYLKLYVKDYHVFSLLQSMIDTDPDTALCTRIKAELLTDIRAEEWASPIDIEQCVLPANRNHTKDTHVHIWNMLHKIPCLSHAVRENPFKSEYFAYMDFEVFDLFHEPQTIAYIREHFGQTRSQSYKQLRIEHTNALYIPGCWGKLDKHFVKSPDFKHNIHWRFCGAFLMGAGKSIMQFDQYYKQYFKTYIFQNDQCLSWEVNYWAWLEAILGDQMPIHWYAGDHNDTLVRVPRSYGYHVLKYAATHYRSYAYTYPGLTPYRPMSASLVYYNDQYILNTRYVNYWIHENGAYWYPEDEHKIRTKNMCAVVHHGSSQHDSFYPVCYKEVKEQFQPPIVRHANMFSEGVEDIRLYVSQKTGQLMFIGSTLNYSGSDKIRMIVGEYVCKIDTIQESLELMTPDTEENSSLSSDSPIRGQHTVITEVCLTNAHVISSPGNQWCEKNWCPIPLGDHEDGFVYKWYPLEIGRLVAGKTPDGRSDGRSADYDLEIIHRVTTNTEIFERVKGSTPFRRYGVSQLIGMIHYSEDTFPRQYYNRLVVLDAETYEICQCTETFCFERVGVEFCMSMECLDTKWVFWISQHDRDPLMIELESGFFDDKWITFSPK